MNKFLQNFLRTLTRPPFKQRILFIKQLSLLMKAGIPLLPSLRMLAQQNTSKSMRQILEQVIADVENGHYLAVALGKHKHVFGELAINIISIGEISGNLSDNLHHLATTLKKQQSLRRKIVSASVYPIFIVIATIAIVVLLVVFFFPKVVPVLKTINYDLPWTTRWLIVISDTLKHHGLLIGAAFLALIIGLGFLLNVKKVRARYDRQLVLVPFLKQCVQAYNMGNICRTLGLLLRSGTVIVRSFLITADTTKNTAYQKALREVADGITRGEKVSSQVLLHPALFPAMVPQMIAIGENTGELGETFLYLADIYEETMDDLTKNLSAIIEPFLLIFMGLLVGFVAISIITPIYGITQHLAPK